MACGETTRLVRRMRWSSKLGGRANADGGYQSCLTGNIILLAVVLFQATLDKKGCLWRSGSSDKNGVFVDIVP
jgi:hypothetical protein